MEEIQYKKCGELLRFERMPDGCLCPVEILRNAEWMEYSEQVRIKIVERVRNGMVELCHEDANGMLHVFQTFPNVWKINPWIKI